MNRDRPIPGPGQESVWDYPRPPRLEDSTKHIQIIFNGVVIADTHRAKRVLETSHPPSYYIPPEDIQMQYLVRTPRSSFCEWKGQAGYYSVVVGASPSGEPQSTRRADSAAWFYANPTPDFAPIKDYVSFYPSRIDTCTVDGEVVQAQAGDFYGGWITKEIIGPFKGGTGTWGW